MKVCHAVGLVLGLIVCIGCQPAKEPAPQQEAPPPVTAETPTKTQTPTSPVETQPLKAAHDLPQPVTLSTQDWPQYRGQQRDGVSKETGLLRSWPKENLKVAWEIAVGQGYAAPSIVAGRVYLNDYDEENNIWMVRCLDLDSGKEHWRYEVKKRIRPNHAITRSAPATDGGFVFAIDPKCELHCLDARNGDLIWKKFFPADYDSQIPAWYNGQCPLIDGDRLVVATGGRVLMTALEKGTGKAIWETENSEQFLLSHSSLMPVELEGVKQYLYTTLKGMVGVDAETGKLLWHFPWKFNTAVSSTPLPVGDGKFLLTGGYHARTVVCQVQREQDTWTANELLSLPPPTGGWNSEVHTPIFYNGHIYGIGKKQRGLWTCLDLEGNEVWTSKGKASFGMGGYSLADGMFFVLEGKTGVLRILDATADHYKELANYKFLEGPDVWSPPIISNGKLLIRDLGKLVCLDIAAEGSAEASAKLTGPQQPAALR